MSTQAKPHIHWHDGYWWVCPWRGAHYGVADPSLREAWRRWKRNSWMRALRVKGKP